MLVRMTDRLFRCDRFEQAIFTVLDDAIGLLGAEYGNVQLLAGEDLLIVAQRGLPQAFLNAFRRVRRGDGSACGRALFLGESVVISDVQTDLQFTVFRDIAKHSHFRAVQSTPLITESGRELGIVSTHFANVHQPSKIEMETLKAYGVVAAQYAFKLLDEVSLDTITNRMHEKLYTSA
jgi:two-component system, sensor histidine kinase